MKSRRQSVRPRLELLEGREVPANLTATFAAGTLTIVGDSADNDITVYGNASNKTQFTLTSSGTINNQAPPYASPFGVKNMVFKMLDGADTITFGNNPIAIDLQGNLSIDGGNGPNTVTANDLTVEKNLSVINGIDTGGTAQTGLVNLNVGGNLSIKNGDGNTATTIDRNDAGESTIKGNLSVTNGFGQDRFYLNDTNVNRNVKINNGHGDSGGVAGNVAIYNLAHTAFRSVIGGNVTVSYLDGNTSTQDVILDTEVMGNVTLNHGTGAFSTAFDGYLTQLPVLIHGNLSITGTGANSLDVGDVNARTGLVVGKNFTLASGAGPTETVSVQKLQVGGNTTWTLGNGGGYTVNIDESLFAGKFSLISGAGSDTINLDVNSTDTSATVFKKAVSIALGTGGNSVNIVFNGGNSPSGYQAIVVYSTFVVSGANIVNQAFDHEFFPNGGAIQFI